MESFFSTLKTERVRRRHYPTRDDARADIFDYIDVDTRRSASLARWSLNDAS